MALTGSQNTWGDAVFSAIVNVTGLDSSEQTQIRNAWRSIVGEHITHLVSSIAVGTTVAVTSVSGVTTGAGVSGPGSGTGTGTIT